MSSPRPNVYYRGRPEDFRVTELPLVEPSGSGGFTWLLVEKIGTNTHDVARQLSQDFERPEHEVAWAGRKDRHAVAQQWFSIPDIEPRQALGWQGEGARVLEASRHRFRLRLGDLAGNRFELRLFVADPVIAEAVPERLAHLERTGFANRFGAQRFGHNEDNVARGAALLAGTEARSYPRRQRALYLSALQAAVFHQVLAERAVGIDEVRPGELVWQHGSGVTYSVRDPAEERDKLDRFEVSPSGPLFGPRMRRPRGACLEEELRALALFGLPPFEQLELPRGVRLGGARRSLRARLLDSSTELTERQEVTPPDMVAPEEVPVEMPVEMPVEVVVRFSLEPGSYATVLLESLFPECEVVEGSGAER